MKRLTVGNLQLVKSDMERIAPSYVLTELNPFNVIDVYYGNCFSKLMVACGIIALRHNVEPSVVYNADVHGKDRNSGPAVLLKKPADPETGKTMAHITAVMPGLNQKGEDKIIGIHFGAETKAALRPTDRTHAYIDKVMFWDDFNRSSNDVYERTDGEIAVTDEGRDQGLIAGNWQRLGNAYLAALDKPTVDFSHLLEYMVEKQVIALPVPLDPAS